MFKPEFSNGENLPLLNENIDDSVMRGETSFNNYDVIQQEVNEVKLRRCEKKS